MIQIDYDGTRKEFEPISVEVAGSLPKEYLLSQNFPNPFNSTSVIKYSIPKLSQVTIKVFNVLGSKIETLVNEEKPVGSISVKIECS